MLYNIFEIILTILLFIKIHFILIYIYLSREYEHRLLW